MVDVESFPPDDDRRKSKAHLSPTSGMNEPGTEGVLLDQEALRDRFDGAPDWLRDHYRTFRESMLGERDGSPFPCYFGIEVEREGDLLYAACESTTDPVGLEITFQPRAVFDGLTADTEAGRRARETIRERMDEYDGVCPTPTWATGASRATASGPSTCSARTTTRARTPVRSARLATTRKRPKRCWNGARGAGSSTRPRPRTTGTPGP